MRAASFFLVALAGWSIGCSNVVSPSLISGLSGIVVRAPLEPVCQQGIPCEAPFSADFTVQQGVNLVTTFKSDALGRFDLDLAPGTYLIVPGPNAPIMSPLSQAKLVVVGVKKSTGVRLEFDTGIR